MPSEMVGEAIAVDHLFDAVNLILSLQVHYILVLIICLNITWNCDSSENMPTQLLSISSVDGKSKVRRCI